jgi:hypothetical protein
MHASLAQGNDVLFVLKKSAKEKTHNELQNEIEAALIKISLKS